MELASSSIRGRMAAVRGGDCWYRAVKLLLFGLVLSAAVQRQQSVAHFSPHTRHAPDEARAHAIAQL